MNIKEKQILLDYFTKKYGFVTTPIGIASMGELMDNFLSEEQKEYFFKEMIKEEEKTKHLPIEEIYRITSNMEGYW